MASKRPPSVGGAGWRLWRQPDSRPDQCAVGMVEAGSGAARGDGVGQCVRRRGTTGATMAMGRQSGAGNKDREWDDRREGRAGIRCFMIQLIMKELSTDGLLPMALPQPAEKG